jgi:hypothetical protein
MEAAKRPIEFVCERHGATGPFDSIEARDDFERFHRRALHGE